MYLNYVLLIDLGSIFSDLIKRSRLITPKVFVYTKNPDKQENK